MDHAIINTIVDNNTLTKITKLRNITNSTIKEPLTRQI